MTLLRSLFSALLMLCLLAPLAVAEEQPWLKPYLLTSNANGTVAGQLETTTSALKTAGMEVVGTYQPYPGVAIIAVTNDNLKAVAGQTERGGYGAVVRVAITQSGDKVQVSHVNPEWMKASFRMKGDLSATAKQLASALGQGKPYGAEEPGWKANQLAEFHFTVFMPYFDDDNELAEHANYAAAIKAVEAGLASGKGGTAKVFRVDIPGKEESLFGVALNKTAGPAGDEHIMKIIDFKDLKQSAHLPYSVLVSGGRVYALHAKFLIANSFPDLDMGTFIKINDAPDAIETALQKAVSAK